MVIGNKKIYILQVHDGVQIPSLLHDRQTNHMPINQAKPFFVLLQKLSCTKHKPKEKDSFYPPLTIMASLELNLIDSQIS